MLTARFALRVVSVSGLLASVACAGRRRADPSAVPQVATCEGRAYLEVTNTLNEPVDVYVGDVYAGQTARAFLGTARPGTTRLPVENWLRKVPWFVAGQTPIVSEAIRYVYQCEPA